MITATKLQIARAVRGAAEKQWPQCRTLRNRCVPVSYCLHWLLEQSKHAGQSYIVRGMYRSKRSGLVDHVRYHVWVQCGRRIFDLTATQFDWAAAPVTILRIPDDRYVFACPVSLGSIKYDMRGYGVDGQASAIISRALQVL